MWERALVAVSRVFGALAALSLCVLMVVIVIEVVARWLTRASVPGMLEIAETSLVVAVYFGLAWTGVRGEHVSVEVVTERLPKRVAWWVDLFVWILTTATVAWILYGATLRAISATRDLEERFGIVRWPLYPARWVIVVGLALLLIVFAQNIVRLLRGRPAFGEDANQVEKAAQAATAEGAGR